MDTNVIAAVVSAIGGAATVGGTIFTTVRSGKDKKDRKADRTVAEATADKIAEEKRKIAEETSDLVIARVNAELARVKGELTEAEQKLETAEQQAEKYRIQLQAKNNEIDIQARTIRRLTRRAEVLEEWIERNCDRFEELGIQALPTDVFGDRLQSPSITEGQTDPYGVNG
jgi:phenylalanyl-tRNA synthetase alpha subunit